MSEFVDRIIRIAQSYFDVDISGLLNDDTLEYYVDGNSDFHVAIELEVVSNGNIARVLRLKAFTASEGVVADETIVADYKTYVAD